MTESVVFTGMGKAPEKRTLMTWGKEKLRKSFTVSGAEEVWREKHAKEIQELTVINASLSDEDRVKAMEKLDKDISNAAKVKVAGNYGAAALVTTAVVGEGLLIGNKNLAKKVADSKYFGPIGRQAQWARGGLDALVGKISQMKKGVKKDRTSPSLLLREGKFATNVPVDITQFFINASAEKLREIQAALEKFNQSYNISNILSRNPNVDLRNSLGAAEAEHLAQDIIEQALGVGGECQPVFFAIGANGVRKGYGGITLRQEEWEKAINIFEKKQLANVVDLGKRMYALVVNEHFGEFAKTLAGES